MTEEKLFNPDLRWHPGTGEMTAAQLAAIHTRHGNAIRPIPSATALGYDHLMADADRGALLAELNRSMEEAYRLREERDRFRNMMNSAVSAGVVIDGERLDALKEVERLEKVVADLKEINDRMGADRVRMADELSRFRSRDNPYAW